MTVRFGTDGVRGRAFDELSRGDARAIGRAAAQVLKADQVVIAHDARESGEALVASLASGFADVGVTPMFLGVAPTPAVAYIAAQQGIIGAMVSASHNAWHDNGIKIFGPGGLKLTDEQQTAMEALLDGSDTAAVPLDAPSTEDGGDRGSAATVSDSVGTDGDGGPAMTADGATASTTLAGVANVEHRLGEYRTHLLSTVAPDALAGLKIVVDAANGAASHVAGPIFADLGADVVAISTAPNGRNINDGCGSTHPEALIAAVLAEGAHLGLALDGDADRLVAVDHEGRVVDGDQVIAICTIDRMAREALADNTVVVTVMTNLGFRIAMQERGVTVAETAVGDRHVLQALDANGWTLGGEQSGHIIFRDLATTGDGLLSGVQLAAIVARSGRPLAELAAESMTRLPQVLENVRIAERVPDIADVLADDIASVEASLGDSGRVLVRASGTEPVIRVMVEAPTEDLAGRYCRQLVERVQARFGIADD